MISNTKLSIHATVFRAHEVHLKVGWGKLGFGMDHGSVRGEGERFGRKQHRREKRGRGGGVPASPSPRPLDSCASSFLIVLRVSCAKSSLFCIYGTFHSSLHFRDVWHMYLERGEFELAKEYCKV